MALARGSYSCTANMYPSALDSWLASEVSGERALNPPHQTWVVPNISREGALSFTLNITTKAPKADVYWAPNGQALRELSADYTKILKPYLYDTPSDAAPNDTLGTLLYWAGPATGLNTFCWAGNVSTCGIAEDKEVRCYAIDSSYDSYSECIRVEQGTRLEPSQQPLAIFHRRRGTFASAQPLRSTLLPSGTGQPDDDHCDWDKISSLQSYPTVNTMTLEFFVPSVSSRSAPNGRKFCNLVVQSKFPTIDPIPRHRRLLPRQPFHALKLHRIHHYRFSIAPRAHFKATTSAVPLILSVGIGGPVVFWLDSRAGSDVKGAEGRVNMSKVAPDIASGSESKLRLEFPIPITKFSVKFKVAKGGERSAEDGEGAARLH
ncbi:hypothetical protein FGG08_004147 [Glutinoglossum americanum]|uniref:Uncharacterized protein n=1 Tax=Glutinoglossum americanum TaxID=1670608 RepID=A0A9P8I182_9PEZI|nr:hypothetical protein FGG08_004147 [Glutinoglossum americanum]